LKDKYGIGCEVEVKISEMDSEALEVQKKKAKADEMIG